ncbi:MAG: hypothetical protein GF313_08835 [Caldithrix sp.]|nr:hypothetical protein [Caldithrix sp.]
MNGLDSVIIIIVAIFTIRGIFRGLITELIVLISIILGFIIAIVYITDASQWLVQYIPEIPEFAARIAAFILLFVTVNIIIRLAGRLLNQIFDISLLKPINRLAGGAFALAKTVFIVSVVILIIEFIPYHQHFFDRIGVQNSALYPGIRGFAPQVMRIVKINPEIPSIQDKELNLYRSLQQADSTAQQFFNNEKK